MPPSKVDIPRRPRGEGQWAFGHLEPLNPNERVKRDDDGLNVRARIENIYSKRGFASIDPQDLRGRFRWYGLYTQRPEEDGYFMVRIRIPGGVLSSDQLRTIAGLSEDLGRAVAAVTARQNVQRHWIRLEDIPELGPALEKAGELYAAGDKEGAARTAFTPICGQNFEAAFDQILPAGWLERWVADIDTLFQLDIPALEPWVFTAADALIAAVENGAAVPSIRLETMLQG
jgi:sulfite reductase beta subunit-like hemoprotein